jgi:hypothetical protein
MRHRRGRLEDDSGTGRDLGRAALDNYTESKTARLSLRNRSLTILTIAPCAIARRIASVCVNVD